MFLLGRALRPPPPLLRATFPEGASSQLPYLSPWGPSGEGSRPSPDSEVSCLSESINYSVEVLKPLLVGGEAAGGFFLHGEFG